MTKSNRSRAIDGATQAIETHYLGPTNNRPGRVVARCDAGRYVHAWDYDLGASDNHGAAALMLAARLGWSAWAAEWTGAGLPGGRMAWICTRRRRGA